MQTQRPTPATTAHSFKGLDDWIEVFRAGSHTDSKGRSCTFAESDLDQMVANLALGPAPAVLGHPKHNDPAYGWVQDGAAKREGASLYVKFSDINPDFAAGVASGAYRNRSVSVFKDADAGWRLQHVGWLGAALPAIAGLAPLSYSAPADQEDAFQFEADDFDIGLALGDAAELLRGVREQLIADKGMDAADAALPNWRIQSLTDTATRVRSAALADPVDTDPAPAPNPFSKPETGDLMSFTQAQLDAATAQARKDAETAAVAQFAAQATELAQLRSAHQAERIGGVIAAAKAAGKLTPAQEPGLAEFMASLESAPAEFSFAKGDGTVKKAPAQFFAEFLAALPVQVKLGQQTVQGDAPALDGHNAAQLADAARAFMAEQAGKGLVVSLPEAVARVSAQAKA